MSINHDYIQIQTKHQTIQHHQKSKQTHIPTENDQFHIEFPIFLLSILSDEVKKKKRKYKRRNRKNKM